MLLVDVHAHMDIDAFKDFGGTDEVISQSAKNGVKCIVTNGIDIATNRASLDLASRHSNVKAALGIYPTHCLSMIESGNSGMFEEELKFISQQIESGKCIAVGEVGLEYKEIPIDEQKKNIQKDCLRRFIQIAKKYNVPIILHSRGAELETVEVLESEGMKGHKVIMHCFSGRKHIVQRVRDNGWSFSIPCNVNRAQHFQQIVTDTPIEQLFTETDAPYLSPTPGTTNRPDNVRFTVETIAQIKKMTPQEVANILYNNFQKMFL